MLASPNPHGRSNRDVVRPWANGLDLVRRPRHRWIIDFGVDMPLSEACKYEAPFRFVQTHVYPERMNLRRDAYRERWWLHAEPSQSMRRAIAGLDRFAVTPAVSKHRVFDWLRPEVLPDHALVVVARADDFTFGVLQSAIHERWALQLGTQLESRPRYTPTTCFETFPFPPLAGGLGDATTPVMRRLRERVATNAVALVSLRVGWVDPVGPDGLPMLTPAELARRTLTNLYNERPTWLERAHIDLDRAVLATYGWPETWADGLQPRRDERGVVDPSLGVDDAAIEQEVLGRLLALNLQQTTR